MRDLVLFVADGTMENAFLGFLQRPDFHKSYNLDISPFAFDSAEDLVRIPGNDPGVFTRGHHWARAYLQRHHHAVVVFDREYGTNLDATALEQDLTNRILTTGWTRDRFKVIVIDPELEAWIWQRNFRVARSLGFTTVIEMVNAVTSNGAEWPEGEAKPLRPKEALEAIVRHRRIGWSSSIHRSITSSVSLVGCQDSSFLELRQALQRWFPPEALQ